MEPPHSPAGPPSGPPTPPGPPGPHGLPVTPGGPVPPSRWTRQRLLVIAAAVVVLGLVIAAVVLATRKPAPSPNPVGLATPSASTSPSASATPSATPTPTPTPTPTATPKPTATPTAVPQNTPTQQAQLLFPGSGSECGSNGSYAGCPMTSDLVTAANQWRGNNPTNPEPLCRCQSTYSSPFAQQNDTLLRVGDQGNPDRAAVQVSLTLASQTEQMVVLLSRQSGVWMATDTYCDNPQNQLTSHVPTTC